MMLSSMNFKYLTCLIALAISVSRASAADSVAAPAATPAVPTIAPTVESAQTMQDAKLAYAQLKAGKVDRSRLSEQLNNGISDDTLTEIATKLTLFGDTKWTFLRTATTPQGRVSIYRLIGTGGSIIFNYGETPDHIVWNLLLSPDTSN